jgi:hypothetical protein
LSEFAGDSEASARRSAKESPELSAGGIERSLPVFATVKERGAALDGLEEDLLHCLLSQGSAAMETADEFPRPAPKYIDVVLDRLQREV